MNKTINHLIFRFFLGAGTHSSFAADPSPACLGVFKSGLLKGKRPDEPLTQDVQKQRAG
jgi:hypothetical protein